MNVQRPERKHLLCRGEIYNHRDVARINGKKYKIFQTSSRRLTKGEENAVAIAGLRMASETRRWIPGEPHEVSVGSVMTKAFNNPRLISRVTFQSWFKRLNIKMVKHSTATRGVFLQVPNDLDGHEVSFGDPGQGTCWQILVKPEVLYDAMKLHADNKWDKPHAAALADLEKTIEELVAEENTPKGDAVTGSHSILGSPEGHQDSETGKGTMDPSGCLKAATPAQSPQLAAANREVSMGLPIIPPEFEPDQDQWQNEVNRIYNERVDNAQMHISMPWAGRLKPSDPATIVEDLNKIDRLLDEAEQMSQVGYEDPIDTPYDPWEEPQVAAPEAQVAAPEAQQVRRIPVPPEVRGWEDDD